MKNSSFTLIAIVFIALSANSIATKAQENKDIAITNFTEVSVSSGIDLYLTQSSSENIRVNAHPDLLKNVVVEKKGNNLSIRYKDNISWGRLFKGQSIKVYVNYKTLQAISASGGSDVYSQNTLKTDKLSISASGGSDIDLNVIAKDIQIQTSGGSDVNIKGNATNMEASSSGGSDIDALGFVVENARVTASGGSDTSVHVTKALDVTASGGSDVNYKGNPAVKKSSGKSGEVNKIN
ncbi:MAG TPA: head GIN domain-containing protein [Pedobacter sp.]|uniref:head GIN domain-containing protein n=1 Tax=Pedobacter sp. TaxID=1411316 RepID=UPI002BD70E07|nr:head GIN domain-containing protein [Pedobacter sp.]HMI05265.1 head GIN domain-containing protein [Pedobacter sp.]